MNQIIQAAAVTVATTSLNKALEEPIKRLSNMFCNAFSEKKTFFSINKEIESDIFLKDYIIKSYDKIGRTKTLLYRDSPQLIENFCICTDLSYTESNLHKKIIKTSNIKNILDYSRKIVITGYGGMGKTIMMKFIHINCIKQLELIPVFVVLRNITSKDNKIDIFECIKNSLSEYSSNINDEMLETSLKKGCYAILFDGFDEIKNELSDTVAQEIIKFSNIYDQNYYIVSSRPSDIFISWSDFKELHTEPLTKNQAISLIDKLEFDIETKSKFKNELITTLFNRHKSFASNPLLLTIMLLVYSDNGFIPYDFFEFYGEAFRVMFYKHDKSKNFKREIHSKLTEYDLENIFAYFCFRSFFKEQFSFNEKELIDLINLSIEKSGINVQSTDVLKDFCENLSMLIKEGLEYKFVHRSFQEYFAAIYTKKIPDTNQNKLLTQFIKNKPQATFSEFFPILHRIDAERLYKNVINGLLDELESTYNSVNRNDYDFLLELLSDYTYGQTTNQTMYKRDNYSLLTPISFLMDLYNNKKSYNSSYLPYRIEICDVLSSFGFDHGELVEDILDKNGNNHTNHFNKSIKTLNAATIIKELYIRMGNKDIIMKYFEPYLNEIKSWFQNRLYQDSSIDDMLDNM
ncbi:MAG: hypothetical protein IJM38_04730 [Ruminococcus sp.]|nr:hypothetical protein [Ruminococcus sp.]